MAIDYNVLGRRIGALRKAQKKTQENLAEYLTVSVGYISQIERGVTRANLDTLSNIADYLGCDMTQLLFGMETRGRQYLGADFAEVYNQLPPDQKKLLLEIARLMLGNC